MGVINWNWARYLGKIYCVRKCKKKCMDIQNLIMGELQIGNKSFPSQIGIGNKSILKYHFAFTTQLNTCHSKAETWARRSAALKICFNCDNTLTKKRIKDTSS